MLLLRVGRSQLRYAKDNELPRAVSPVASYIASSSLADGHNDVKSERPIGGSIESDWQRPLELTPSACTRHCINVLADLGIPNRNRSL